MTASPDPRLLVIESEFPRVLGVARRDGNTLSPVVRDAWDTGNLRVMTRKDPLRASGAHICMIAHTTAAELLRRLDDVEIANGFLNRWLMVYVKRARLLPSGGGTDEAELVRLADRIRLALTRAKSIQRLQRTPQAEVRWAELYEVMADDDGGDLASAATARAEAQVLRLSLVYALMDGAQAIDLEHLEAAWALWSYCRGSARYLFGDSLGDPVADKLLAALTAAGDDGLDATAQRKVFSRHESADRITRALDLLVAKELARRDEDKDTGGRPRQLAYALSPPGGAESAISAERGVRALSALRTRADRR